MLDATNKKMKKHLFISFLAAALLLGACGTKNKVVDGKKPKTQKTDAQTGATAQTGGAGTATMDAAQKLNIVRSTADQAVYQRNVVAKIDFTVNTGSKDITLDGQLRMKRDEVIRLQISPLGLVEVARIEFTPDYVLLMDRVHKTYIKGRYDEIGFLRRNGLNFYSLQALFWNQLFVPGKNKVGEAEYAMYDVDLTPVRHILFKQNRMDFAWTVAEGVSDAGRINQATVTYADPNSGDSKLEWNYSDFRSMGSKWFPYDHQVKFSSAAVNAKKAVKVRMKINKVTDDGGWDTQTSVSDKYKKVTAEDILQQITGRE